MRPEFEPQACRVPARRGIYLISMIVDTSKGACRMHHGREPLALLPVLCCRHAVSARPCIMLSYGRVAQRTDKAYVCCYAHRHRKLGPRENKAKNEYVLLVGSSFSW